MFFLSLRRKLQPRFPSCTTRRQRRWHDERNIVNKLVKFIAASVAAAALAFAGTGIANASPAGDEATDSRVTIREINDSHGAAEASVYAAPNSPTSVVAQMKVKSVKLTEQEYAELISAFENSEWGKRVQYYGQDRSVGTAVIKKALKWALHHERDIVKGVEKWVGKEPARRVEKVIYDISPTLRKLLRYEDLVWQTVQDQLSPVIGRDLAFWITKVIEWIAPV